MKANVYKYFPAVIASFALISGVHADEKRGDANHTPSCMDMCYAGPKITCDDNWELSAAAVYQQVSVQGGEVALKQDAGTRATAVAYPVNAAGVVQPEDFAWGFKVGAGYRNLVENWRLAVHYSYLKVISNSGLETGYNFGYAPSMYTNHSILSVDSTSAPFVGTSAATTPLPTPLGNWINTLFQNLEMGNSSVINNLNFTIERPSLITSHLEMTPYYGVSATIITRRQVQVYTNDYVPQYTQTQVTQSFYSASAGAYFQNYQKFNWWGVGPMLGVHSSWKLAFDLSIYGDAYGALTYGQANSRTSTFSKRTTLLNQVTVAYLPIEAVIRNSMYQFSPEANFNLGVRWERNFDNDSKRARVQIGYESSYYFYVMKTIVNDMNYRVEDGAGLGAQGLVLEGRFDF
ncbi:MAG: Lpg1974 family pore-forming outer membrane protein [Chlamydiia bacterium]